MRCASIIVLGFALAVLPGFHPCMAADAEPAAGAQDPYFGEALFNAYQGRWFEALQRLDSEFAQHYRVDEQTAGLPVSVDRSRRVLGRRL